MNQLTKRAENLLVNSNYSKESIGSDQIVFEVIGDKKLTVSYIKTTNELKNLLAEVLCIFLNNRNAERILQIEFKEFENFLRDQNNVPSFDNQTISIVENYFTEAISDLICAWLKVNLKFPSKLDFMDKIRFGNEIFISLNTFFNLNHQYKFVFFEYEFLYFFKSSTIKNNQIEAGISKYFLTSQEMNILLVAVKG